MLNPAPPPSLAFCFNTHIFHEYCMNPCLEKPIKLIHQNNFSFMKEKKNILKKNYAFD